MHAFCYNYTRIHFVSSFYLNLVVIPNLHMKQHAAAHIQNGTGEVYKNDLIIIGSQEFLANDEVCIKLSYILCFFNPYIAGKF